jgi:hypothetical protein
MLQKLVHALLAPPQDGKIMPPRFLAGLGG